MGIYTVQRGDTLTKIANKFGIGLNDLLRLNPEITNPNLIRVGQKIRYKKEETIIEESKNSKVTKDTSFIGIFEGTWQDLVAQFTRHKGPTVNFTNCTIEDLAKLYIKWGQIFNLRADLAWAQMEHETGYLQFKGDVKGWQNNFVGIGATGRVPGNIFKTPKLGVIAHYAHLAWYYFENHVNEYCSKEYDPRHFGNTHYNYNGNTSLDRLSGSWAVPGRYKQPDGSIITYGGQIAKTANTIFISSPMTDEVEETLNQFKDFFRLGKDRNWQYIAIHHTVSSQMNTTMAQIRQWHLARNFLQEGYHFGINGKGGIEDGRPLNMSGAHAGPKWNGIAIGVALYGDFRTDKLTKAQKEAAYELCSALMHEFKIPLANVKGHREFGLATACPVINMNTFRNELSKF